MTWPEAVKLSVATGEVCVRLRDVRSDTDRALAVGSEAVMASEYAKWSHIEGGAIRIDLQAIQGHVGRMEDHADRLGADVAALKAYALALEAELDRIEGATVVGVRTTTQMRAEHPRAAALLDQDEDG